MYYFPAAHMSYEKLFYNIVQLTTVIDAIKADHIPFCTNLMYYITTDIQHSVVYTCSILYHSWPNHPSVQM